MGCGFATSLSHQPMKQLLQRVATRLNINDFAHQDWLIQLNLHTGHSAIGDGDILRAG